MAPPARGRETWASFSVWQGRKEVRIKIQDRPPCLLGRFVVQARGGRRLIQSRILKFYSSRRVWAGSRRVRRKAGRALDSAATAISNRATDKNVMGSVAVTPQMRLFNRRV